MTEYYAPLPDEPVVRTAPPVRPAPAREAADAHADAHTVPRWEMVLAALCLAQATEPFFAAFYIYLGLTEPPSWARLVWLPIYLFVLFVAVRDWRQVVAVAPRALLLGVLALLAVLSVQWSVSPSDTMRRAVGLVFVMGLGVYFAWRYSWPQLLNTMALAWAVLIAGSYVVALFLSPMHYMRDEHPGAWSGLWTHKNQLAGLMALGIGILVSAAVVNPRQRAVWSVFALMAFVLLILSTGMTGLLASIASVGVIAAVAMMRRGPVMATLLATGAIALVMVAGGMIVLAPEAVVALIGRDLTFTGRTDIWESLLRAIEQRPWLGYGFGAFWVDDFGPKYWIQRDVDWKVPNAHNGWLELTLAVGKIGLAVFVVQFALTLYRAARFSLHPVAGVWAPAILVAFSLYAFSESYILIANGFWVLYVIVSVKLAIAANPKPGVLATAR